MKRSISVLGGNGCCMLLRFAWQLALPLQAFMQLAAAGDIRKLPLRRLVMIAIVGLYSIRVIVGIGWLLYEFTCLQFFSTLVPAFLVYCYLPGLKRNVDNQMLL